MHLVVTVAPHMAAASLQLSSVRTPMLLGPRHGLLVFHSFTAILLPITAKSVT